MLESRKREKNENPLETLADRLANDLVTMVENAPEFPPFGAVRLSERQQLQEYLKMSQDPGRWSALLDQHGMGEVLRYATEMERLRQKYADEASPQQAPGAGVTDLQR